MRVEKISFFNNNNYTFGSKQVPYMASNLDSVSFSGKSDESGKKTFLDKLKGAFLNIGKLTPEEEKSNDINNIVFSLDSNKRKLNKTAKTYTKLLKGYLSLGRNNDWYSINLAESERVLFSERNPDSLGEQTITRVDMANGMSIKDVFHVHSLFGFSFTVDFPLDDDTDCSLNVLSERALSVSEVDKDTNVKRTLVPKLDGFYFISGLQDENGEILNPDLEINYVFDDDSKTYYKERNENGDIDIYKPNPKSGLWELQKEE